MRSVRMPTVWGLCTAICLAAIGCTQEAWQRGGTKTASDNPDAGSKARRPREDPNGSQDARTAKTDASGRASKPNDARALQVEDRVADYAQTVQARYNSAAKHGDFNAKIARHSDPEYRRRIRQTALTAYDRPATPPSKVEAKGTDPGEAVERSGADSTVQGDPGANASSGTPTEKPSPMSAERQPIQPSGMSPPADSPSGDDRSPASTHRDPGRAAGEASSRPPILAGVKAGDESGAGVAPAVAAEKTATGVNANTGASTVHAKNPGDDVQANRESSENGPRTPVETNRPSEADRPVSAEHLVPDKIGERVRTLEAGVAKDPNNLDDQLRLRMLFLASGEDDKAVAVPEGMNEDTQQLVLAYVRAIKSARAPSGRDPAAWANEQLPNIEALRDLIRSQADLQVPRVVLCESIEGFGVYEPIDPPQFALGQKAKALLYIEVDNYHSEKTASGKHRTLLSLRLSLLDKNGKELWSQPPTDNIEDVARERRRDFFLTYGPLTIPKDLVAGTYVLKVEVEDVLAQKTNSATAEFKIVQREALSSPR